MAEVIQQSRYHFGDNRRYMVMIHVFMTFYRLDLTSPKNKIFRGESKTINVNANVTGWHKNKELMKVSELFFYSKIVETITPQLWTITKWRRHSTLFTTINIPHIERYCYSKDEKSSTWRSSDITVSSGISTAILWCITPKKIPLQSLLCICNACGSRTLFSISSNQRKLP